MSLPAYPQSLASYVELLGLPGSGKTTLTRFMLRRHRAKFSGVARRQRVQVSLEGAKALLLDQAAGGSFAAYPGLFSRVFEALKHVTNEGREREILINYWRSRVSSYRRATDGDMKKSVIVDEGLVQTVFSTLMRIDPDLKTEEGDSFAQSLMGSLPTYRRILILIDTPLTVANERQLRNRKAIHRFSNPKGQEKIYELYGIAHGNGVIARKIDGCTSLNLMAEQLSEILVEALSSSHAKISEL